MGTLIKNGTVVNADGSQHADVLIEGEKIAQVAANIPEANHRIVDATNLLVMPGGIDVHTHLDMPFGGTVRRRLHNRHAGRGHRRHNHRHRLRAADPMSTLAERARHLAQEIRQQSLHRLLTAHGRHRSPRRTAARALREMEEMVEMASPASSSSWPTRTCS